MLTVCEIYTSIQGETTFAGQACTFVRLSGCNLRCRWCDTAYAWEGGSSLTRSDILGKVAGGPYLVTVTGGEPLLQEETPLLVRDLLQADYTVLVETNGTLPIDALDPDCIRILDLKPPSSGFCHRIRWENLTQLLPWDEVKIVIAGREDYRWACALLQKEPALRELVVHFSPAFGLLAPSELAEWILSDGVPVRLNLQLHRLIWPGEARRR